MKPNRIRGLSVEGRCLSRDQEEAVVQNRTYNLPTVSGPEGVTAEGDRDQAIHRLACGSITGPEEGTGRTGTAVRGERTSDTGQSFNGRQGVK